MYDDIFLIMYIFVTQDSQILVTITWTKIYPDMIIYQFREI